MKRDQSNGRLIGVPNLIKVSFLRTTCIDGYKTSELHRQLYQIDKPGVFIDVS